MCETIAKESQVITVYLDKKKFGKVYTVIDGINEKEINTKELIKKLKNRLACGGTFKDGKVELQGNHSLKIKDILSEAGFDPSTIQIKARFAK